MMRVSIGLGWNRRLCTVNSEIFARGLFSRKFGYEEFRKIKPSRNSKNSLSFTDVGKSCQSHAFFYLTNMLTNIYSNPLSDISLKSRITWVYTVLSGLPF